MQNRVISDPVVQRDPIETPPDPSHPMKASPTVIEREEGRFYDLMRAEQRPSGGAGRII